jgi:putative transcriptional regulator
MRDNRNKSSKILNMVEEELHSLGKIKDVSMSIREFNEIKYPAPRHYTSRDVIRIRRKLHVSQAVLARFLNASESTIKKWEIGAKVPGGANCRLLQLLERKGPQILMV